MSRIKVLLSLITAIAVAIIIFILIIIFAKNSDDDGGESNKTEIATACELFNLDDAKHIFGQNVAKDTSNNYSALPFQPESTSSTEKFNNCVYVDSNIQAPELSVSTQELEADDIPDPAPEGDKKPVENPSAFLDETRSDLAEERSIQSNIVVVITLKRLDPDIITDEFNQARHEAAEELSGYGEGAYWAELDSLITGEKEGRLSILSNRTIITVTGSIDRETAVKIAEIISRKL